MHVLKRLQIAICVSDVQCIDLELSIADCKYPTILSTLGHSELNICLN